MCIHICIYIYTYIHIYIYIFIYLYNGSRTSVRRLPLARQSRAQREEEGIGGKGRRFQAVCDHFSKFSTFTPSCKLIKFARRINQNALRASSGLDLDAIGHSFSDVTARRSLSAATQYPFTAKWSDLERFRIFADPKTVSKYDKWQTEGQSKRDLVKTDGGLATRCIQILVCYTFG